MKILAIETATEACSAAVYDAGGVIERYQVAPREHNRLILPMVEAVLAEAGLTLNQLDALAFGRGPGSFTGVRVAAGVTQGIAFGADLRVVPVSTLAALALEALEGTGLEYAYPCIDARMGEVYWAVYRRAGEGVALVVEEAVLPATQVAFPEDSRGVGIGSGWGTYGVPLAEQLEGRAEVVLAERFPRAGVIARLGAGEFGRGMSVPVEKALPVYLRDNVAKKMGER
ncbi:tRNA (adenosine(37)-N6)-threonylcarbamoyltransferase complex dimerization subunit type 1 TsaB [Methylomagnum sp.]